MATPRPPLLIRPSSPDDLAAMATIYGAYVRRGTGTFEIDAPTPQALGQRRTDVLAAGWPWLVAQQGGAVKAYAYAAPFRPRPAYRFCLEDSIYVAEDCGGRGVGRALLAELLSVCEARGARQMLAVIGDTGNQASIALHRALGFEHVGVLQTEGWKFNRWLDVVMMQRPLGLGSSEAAPAGG